MSYCRLGPDSDVYIIQEGDNRVGCYFCRIPHPKGPWKGTYQEAIAHVKQHIARGHEVPAGVLEELQEDADEFEQGKETP